ncbi:MAG: hypothetical protein ACLQF1_01875 [Methyloceanibacter sp.]
MANIVSIERRRPETIGADVDRYLIGKQVSELIEWLHELHESRGDEVFDHAARDLIAATAAVLAHQRGYRRAFNVLDVVRADP